MLLFLNLEGQTGLFLTFYLQLGMGIFHVLWAGNMGGIPDYFLTFNLHLGTEFCTPSERAKWDHSRLFLNLEWWHQRGETAMHSGLFSTFYPHLGMRILDVLWVGKLGSIPDFISVPGLGVIGSFERPNWDAFWIIFSPLTFIFERKFWTPSEQGKWGTFRIIF